MSKQALQLTTYFGERSRIGGRLLADEMLDIHARHAIRGSILLRGVQGFGAKHRLRTDRLLTLSEDLPLVAVAVDYNDRIEALLRDVSMLRSEGLMTLERTRVGGAELADTPSKSTELERERSGAGKHLQSTAEALKLTVYLGRHERVSGSPAFAAVCEILNAKCVAGATVLLGVDGARHGRRQRARFFARNADVPLMVISVGAGHRIQSAMADIAQIVREPLFTLEQVRVCKRDGVLLESPHDDAAADQQPNLRQKLTIILSEAARHENRSTYLELVRRLRMANAAGATSLRGIWGFHGDHPPHGDRLLTLRRHVPVITTVIDTPARIAVLFSIVDELTRESGLVTSELVPANSALHTAPRL